MSTAAGKRSADAHGDGEPSLRAAAETANTLLLTPSMDPSDDEGCGALSAVAPPAEMAMLWITFSQTPGDRLAVWRAHVNDRPPARTEVVDVGSTMRSRSTPPRPLEASTDVSIETVSPSDLTGLGITLTDYASKWGGGEGESVVCFHSLSMLLQYVDLQQAFRFLHAATGCIRSAGAAAHFHMDPAVHDERTLNTVRMLFDAVVEPDDDGWHVTLR